jgi:putative SOS response-associated peptidase YedK
MRTKRSCLHVHVPQLKALLAPYPAVEMICWPVSARVGNVQNNDASLIELVTAS